MIGSQRDVIQILTQDHREVEAIFAELETTSSQQDAATLARRKNLVNQATIRIRRHIAAEQVALYPRLAEQFSAEYAGHRHATAELAMKRLAQLSPADRAFDEHLTVLIREIRGHITETEELFPAIRAAFRYEELIEIGRQVETIKIRSSAGGRHSTPQTPFGNNVFSPVTHLMSRVRKTLSRPGKR